VVDTAMHFSTVTSIDPPKFVENSNYQLSNKKKTKAYSPYSKKTIYQNKNKRGVGGIRPCSLIKRVYIRI